MAKNKKSSFSSNLKTLFLGGKNETLNHLEEEELMTPLRTIIKNYRENGLAMFGMYMFIFIFIACFTIPIFMPLDTTFTDATQANVAPGLNMMSAPKDLVNDLAVIGPGATFGVGASNQGYLYIYGQITDSKIVENIPSNLGYVVDIAAGNNHVVALNDQNQVFAWGYDRLGVTTIPGTVDYLKGDIIDVEAGFQLSWLLTDAGEVVYWGNENLMDIGNFAEHQGNIKAFELNTSTGILLTNDGDVISLSTKDSATSVVPEELAGKVTQIAMTERTAAALTNEGKVVLWGERSNVAMNIPEELNNHTVVQLESGLNHYTVLTSEGKVFSWGANGYNQINVPSNLGTIVELYTDYHQNYAIDSTGKMTTWGLKGHLLGTDTLGRDIFTRLVSGGRMTITVGAIAVVISTVIGIIIGGVAGYYGGTLIDNVLMRFAEIVNGLPFLPFAMILSNMLGNSVSETGRIILIMVILGFLNWPGLSRLVRAQILAEREKEFVTAAKAIGVKELGIIFKHIIPNIITVIIVSVTLSFASSMLTESTLSFLGFGVNEPNPTWGNMLTSAQDSKIISTYWWQWVFPALALSLATISINSIGDGLRDATDPHAND